MQMRCSDFAMRCSAASGIIPVAVPALLPVTPAEATLVACVPIGIQVPNRAVTRCMVIGAEPCGASNAAKILSAGAHVKWTRLWPTGRSMRDDSAQPSCRTLPALVLALAVLCCAEGCPSRALLCVSLPIPLPGALRCIGPRPPIAVARPVAMRCIAMLCVVPCVAGPVVALAILVPNDRLVNVVVAAGGPAVRCVLCDLLL